MTVKTKESKRIRDLIRIGVFSALWIAVSWLVGCTIGFFPPVLLVLPCILSLGGALILVVLLSRVHIRGGIVIPSFLFGLCLFSMVPYGMLFFCTLAGGIIGEIIYSTAGRNSEAGKMTGITCPMIGIALGEYIPLGYMQEAFKIQYSGSFTGPIGIAAMELISTPLIIVLTAVTIICSIIGCFWGKSIVAERMAREGRRNNEKIAR